MPRLSTPALVLLAACSGRPAAQPADTVEPLDTADTAPEPVWLTLPADCTPPPITTAAPIVQLGEIQDTETGPSDWFMELVDVELSEDGTRLWGAGQGGLISFDVSTLSAPALDGYYPPGDVPGRLYRVEPAGERLYATHRDEGLTVFDVRDPAAPVPLSTVAGDGWEGLARVGERLYVVSLVGEIAVLDVSTDPPAQVGSATGLGNAWDIVVSGEVAYVADSALGVAIVDLSVPDAPVVRGSVDVGGGVQDLALGDGVLYAAAGSGGVVALDLSTPDAPVMTASLDYGVSVQSVALDGDVLWAVNQEDLIAIDVSSPLAPSPLGTAKTAEFAMHVTARDGVAFVGDWSRLGSWTVDAATQAPDIDPAVSEVFLREEAGVIEVPIANTGAGTLTLSGASVADERIAIAVSGERIPSGGSITLRLEYAGGADLDTELCIASDDPDAPQTRIALHTGSGGAHEAIGSEAPDFVLEDLDGAIHQLSEQRGHPVVLVYFATW